MTVESYFELYLAVIGWQQYDRLWALLTGTGLAYLPFLVILLTNILEPITSQETRDAATTSVKRMEVDMLIAFTVVVLAASPAFDLSASILKYNKPCATVSGPPGTFTAGSTGTTFDNVFQSAITAPAQVPVWWWGVMAISSGINRQAISAIGCAADLSGFQMEIARTRIHDPMVMNEVNKFVKYCYRPARAKLEREQPDIAALVQRYGPEDIEWIGSHVLLETPGYYDNPAFRPLEPIRGWAINPTRDTEYPQPLYPGVDSANGGRPLCNEWWTTSLRGKVLNSISPEVLGISGTLSSEFVLFEGGLTQEKVEDAMLKSVLGSSLATAPMGSALIPSLNDEKSLSVPRLAGGLGLNWENLSFTPMMYVVRAALPIFQAMILAGLYTLLPFALVAGRYTLQSLMMLSIAVFTVKFWSYLWHYAKWLEDNLIKVLYPDGLSSWIANGLAFFGSNYLVAGDYALKQDILNFAVALMYIVLPMIFSFLMGAVGYAAAVGFGLITAELTKPVKKAGGAAAEEAKGLSRKAATKR